MTQQPQAPRVVVPTAKPFGRLQLAIRLACFLAMTGLVALTCVVGGLYLYYAPTIPAFDSIDDYQPKVGTRVYSADNQLIGEFAIERRVLVPPERIPPLLYRAFMSAEDKRFFEHGGLDYLGMLQAVFDKLRHPGEKLRGASTITQQVAKSLLVTHESYELATERSLSRKLREAILAKHLEKTLTKEQILYMYATQTFLGHKAYGVGAAAEHYFRKNVWELTLAEMATLAGLPQRPSDYSPYSNPKSALGRRKYVLQRMYDDGYIPRDQFLQASAEELKTYPRDELYLQIAPYYTEQVRRELIDRYGERALLEDGLRVYTAVNLEFQAHAQAAIDLGLHELDKRQGYRGPVAHLDTAALRQLFATRYRTYLGWKDGAQAAYTPGSNYFAVVKEISQPGDVVTLDIAGQTALMPLAAMRWARDPNPMERFDGHYVTDAHQVLAVGDVVSVSPTSNAMIKRDPHGWPIADKAPKQGDLFALEQEPIAQAALMSVEPNSGYISVQIGGYDFDESSYNRAVQACREPGSAFKPVVYSAAIDKLDYTASTLIDDKPLVFDDPNNASRWKPNNAGEQYSGRIPMRTCLQNSINTPAIRIAEAVGIEDILKNARRLGIVTKLKRELGTALGSSCTTLHELMNMYTTINQGGTRRELKFIRRVVDRYGNLLEDNTVSWDPTLDVGSRFDRAYARSSTPTRQVLDPQTAFIMTSLLKNVIDGGTGVGASHLGQPVAGKTGTTNDSYDAWFMAFTPAMVTGVWVGHDKKERPLGINEQGGRTALPVWVYYMDQATMDRTGGSPRRIQLDDFAAPPGVVKVAIDPATGLLARPTSHPVMEYYRAGTEPTDYTPDKAVVNPRDTDIFNADSPL